MKLNTYLIKFKITSEQFARRVGSSYSAVCKWRAGDRIPSRSWMLKIKQITRSKVLPEDWSN